MIKQARRIQQALSKEEINEVLLRNSSGVLSLIDENGNPYGVPLNYVFVKNKLIFHTLKIGYKIDLINKNENCAFTIIDKDDIVEKDYTSLYQSVIIQGTIKVISDPQLIIGYINSFTDKFVHNDNLDERSKIIERTMNRLVILELTINQISGKKALDLVNKEN